MKAKIPHSEYYANTVLTLESKIPNAVQRIADETFINYDLISDKTFYLGKYVNKEKIISLYIQGYKEYNIYKQTNVRREIINKIIKEYNSAKSARQPII